MKYTCLLACLILCSVCAGVNAAPVDAAFDSANRAFGEGKYADAVAGYEKILQQNGYSAAVLFNLGNAYYRNGQVGRAILNYERALRLTPRDPDILANLKYVRTQSNLPQPTERWWRTLLKSLTPSQWAWTASGLLTLLCAVWIIRLLRAEVLQRAGVGAAWQTPVWRLILFVNGTALFLAIGCGAMSMQERHEAVVVAKEASLLISPFDKSESLATLPEGESVTAEKKYGSYILVRYEKGKSGWVNQSQIIPVEPDLFRDSP